MLTIEQKKFLGEERVARIATVNADGTPHLVPICFAFDGEQIYSTLIKGEKRLANMVRRRHASILVDQYQEEKSQWTVLKGVLMYGEVQILVFENQRQQFMRGWRLLIEKYPQYRHWASDDSTPKDPDRRRMMLFVPLRSVAWGFS
jgi:nitroimidazol reductase NimA-like FMN-containing flavoprotein (pyridoxamine 5'-phosphate oxidase superfamily)